MDATPIDFAPYVVKATTEPATAIAEMTKMLEDILAELSAIDAAAKVKGDGTKSVSPLETLYEKDEPGQKAALAYLRSKVFDVVTDYCADNPQNTYHMLNAWGVLGKYLKGEVDYFNFKATPKAPKASMRQVLRRKFNETRNMLGFVAGIVSNLGYDWKSDPNLKDQGGKPVSKYGGLRGVKSEDSQASGRYAKVYRLDWNIDGEDIDDWSISDLVRYIWTGPERIGKTAKDLAEILDTHAPGWGKSDFKGKTFKVNGHTVKIATVDTGETQ